MVKFISRKNIFLLLIISVSLLGTSFQYSTEINDRHNPENLRLTIKVVKKEIYNKLPMRIELFFNSKKGTYKLYHCGERFGMKPAVGTKYYDWIRFLIISPEGKIVDQYSTDNTYGQKRPWKGDEIDITPKTPYREIINVYPHIEDEPPQPWPSPGDYLVLVTYSLKNSKYWKYQDLWEGRVRSNWITVRVRPETKKEKRSEKQIFVINKDPKIGAKIPQEILGSGYEPYFIVLSDDHFWPAYNVEFNKIRFKMAYDENDTSIVYLETNDKKFVTPEGFSLDFRYDDIHKAKKGGGWYSGSKFSIILESTWIAEFSEKTDLIGEKPLKNAKPIKFFIENYDKIGL